MPRSLLRSLVSGRAGSRECYLLLHVTYVITNDAVEEMVKKSKEILDSILSSFDDDGHSSDDSKDCKKALMKRLVATLGRRQSNARREKAKHFVFGIVPDI